MNHTENQNPEVIDRFFIKANAKNEIIGIYRLVHNEKEQWVRELIWRDEKWIKTDNLIGMLIGLDIDFDEVEKAVINQVSPEVDTSPFIRD